MAKVFIEAGVFHNQYIHSTEYVVPAQRSEPRYPSFFFAFQGNMRNSYYDVNTNKLNNEFSTSLHIFPVFEFGC